MPSATQSRSSGKPSIKALILAGGSGTRLRPLTYAMAKQLVPVANKPILHYALDSLYLGGVRNFGIIISPETGEAIQSSVLVWSQQQTESIDTTFILQDKPEGLAHAVKIAEDYLEDSPFIMYLGDNLINADLSMQINTFLSENNEASILLKRVKNPSSFGVAELNENNKVIKLVEKPKEPKSDLALIGVYLFRASIFKAIASIKPSWRGELEITDAIQELINTNQAVSSQVHEGWWLDTGKKDDLLEANQVVLNELKSNIVGMDASNKVSGIVHVGRNSTLTNCTLEGPVAIGDNCKITNTTLGKNTSIGSGCTLNDCHIQNSVLLENCVISNINGVIENSLLGKNCTIAKPQSETVTHQFTLADHSVIQLV